MLVLSRKTDEIVDLVLSSGEVIEVMVVAIQGDKVRLGFKADKHVRINRREVTERIAAEQRDNKLATLMNKNEDSRTPAGEADVQLRGNSAGVP